MKTVYADKHVLHAPIYEIDSGELVDCAEVASRATNVHQSLIANNIGPIIAPQTFPIEYITRVHNPGYIHFLQNASKEWKQAGKKGDVFATNFNSQHNFGNAPKCIEGQTGFYMADTSVCITNGTWDAIEQSSHAALTALDFILDGESSAFALCRPPGHHATASCAAGYCFLNNAAIATQAFIDKGHNKVSILDIDYHHGNGTQEIFYDRDDVLFCSLHADPDMDFPYFSGRIEERGKGRGDGYNQNYPMPLGTDWSLYKNSLDDALGQIERHNSDILIVSLGVDTYEKDPISHFKLTSEDYLNMGQKISKLNKHTLFIMEGGYAVDDIGTNVVNFLKGFLER